MAKNNYELHDFSAGTITNGDAADIPPGAAQDSLNISCTSKLGAAQTIWGHNEINRKVEDDDTITYTCLLYTSPSPRDLSTSRMPSSA